MPILEPITPGVAPEPNRSPLASRLEFAAVASRHRMTPLELATLEAWWRRGWSPGADSQEVDAFLAGMRAERAACHEVARKANKEAYRVGVIADGRGEEPRFDAAGWIAEGIEARGKR